MIKPNSVGGFRSKLGSIPDHHFENEPGLPGESIMSEEASAKFDEWMEDLARKIKGEGISERQQTAERAPAFAKWPSSKTNFSVANVIHTRG